MSASAISHLEPSELGTKEYWDAAYATELDNQAADPADTGHVWFSESDAETRVAAYLDRLEEEEEKREREKEGKDGESGGLLARDKTTFLDLGSGNGSMLRALRADGWRADMLGVDYSEASVALARRAASVQADADAEAQGEAQADGATGPEGAEEDDGQRQEGPVPAPALRFEVWDLITGEYEPWLWARSTAGQATSSSPSSPDPSLLSSDLQTKEAQMERRPWDVLLDKGTFDAISLSGEQDGQGRRIVEMYRRRIKPLIARGTGMFLITSCNWTEEELERWFVGPEEAGGESDGGFVLHGKVRYPTFRFGGKEGQAISSVCFRRT